MTTALTPTRNTAGTKPAVLVEIEHWTRNDYAPYTTAFGFLYSRDNTIPDTATAEEAAEILTIENSDTPASSHVVRKEAPEFITYVHSKYVLTVVDAQKTETTGYGVWVRGFITFEIDGVSTTYYNDPQYCLGLQE